ncbi:MAG: arginine--tRNA ligase, partial [Clostridia bacterium]
MKKFIIILQEKLEQAFEKCGYDTKYAKVIESNRPDLCEFQCDGALTAAKEYKKAPIIIAEEVVEKCKEFKEFESIEAIKPGFINIKVSKEFITEYCNNLIDEEKFGCKMENDKTVVIDYGGPNIAKPLHVGHLRPAIIGESVKRIHKFFDNKVIGDVHLGDWGLQMGLVIEELKVRHPEWVYFDEDYTGEYPKEAPFTVNDLEEIYPCASAKTKVSEDATEEEKEKANQYKENARINTGLLQEQKKGYYDLWKKIVEISVKDLKENYKKLDVDFDLWLGESDSQKYVEDMVNKMKELGIIYESDGAMVVDVQEPDDTSTINPCMVLKKGGVSCYQTTDLATIMQREIDFSPDEIIYVVDKRQDLHFLQVFRCARKAKLVKEDTKLIFLGFGTMNGKDGKPFKTRNGGVMRLENLIAEVNDKVYTRIKETREISEEEAQEISKIVGLAALKYADLSNQISKDYIFDIDKFTSLDGNTGPYILYTLVRIKSILKK